MLLPTLQISNSIQRVDRAVTFVMKSHLYVMWRVSFQCILAGKVTGASWFTIPNLISIVNYQRYPNKYNRLSSIRLEEGQWKQRDLLL